MARVARCVKCGRFFETRKPNQVYCVEQCRPRTHYTKRSSTERGYGAAHQKRRKQLLPLAYGTPCPICGLLMLLGQALDLDHSTPISKGGTEGDRITHAFCNRSRADGVRSNQHIARRARAALARQARPHP
jgi:hypothetical protein